MWHSGILFSLWSFHLGQHADHERQQFLQRVEVHRLPGNRRLDATLPVRPRLPGFSATLHDKGPIGREGEVGTGTSSSPGLRRALVVFLSCPHVET